MLNVKLVLQYDGSDFSGWQRQHGRLTVQGEVERVIGVVTRQEAQLTVAGRTDAGVHALGQVANFTTDYSGPLPALQRSINALVRPKIAVTRIEEAEPSFHARFDAVSRLYRYSILNRAMAAPLLDRYVLRYSRAINVEAMEQALQYLKGEHDFASFRAASCQSRSTMRRMYDAWLVHQGDMIQVFFHANAFLQQMIRILVGTLLAVGQGELQPADIARILAARDRTQAGPTADPRGLCLLAVSYGVVMLRPSVDHTSAWW